MYKRQAADLIAVNLSGLQYMPQYDLASSLVYATSGNEVQWSWVAGKRLVSAGALQTLDYTDLAERAGRWSDQLGAFRQTLES